MQWHIYRLTEHRQRMVGHHLEVAARCHSLGLHPGASWRTGPEDGRSEYTHAYRLEAHCDSEMCLVPLEVGYSRTSVCVILPTEINGFSPLRCQTFRCAFLWELYWDADMQSFILKQFVSKAKWAWPTCKQIPPISHLHSHLCLLYFEYDESDYDFFSLVIESVKREKAQEKTWKLGD